MEYHSLFLPLLGGFLFYHLNWLTAYKANTEPAQKVLFGSATIGLILLLAARLIGFIFEELKPGSFLGWPLARVGAAPFLVSIITGCIASLALRLVVRSFQWGMLLGFVIPVVAGVAGLKLPYISQFISVLNSPPIDHIHLIWLVLSIAVIAISVILSRAALVPLGISLIKVGISGLIAVGMTTAVAVYQEEVLRFWQALTAPLKGTEASNGIGTAFLACILGPLSALAFNFLYSKRAAAISAMRRGYTSALQKLIFQSTAHGELLMITMQSGKVYICRVAWIPPNPRAKETFLNIWPVKSGYRDPTTHEVTLRTDYESVRKRIHKTHWARFQKVIRLDDVASANFFDEKYFKQFTKQKPRISPRSGQPAA